MGWISARLTKAAANLFPAYRRTGARVTRVSDDGLEVEVELPLDRRTRNVVGTTFGGSMYAAVDPIYMAMLMRLLGPDYVVWDKAASIRFRRPGRATLFARFRLPATEPDEIRTLLATQPKCERTYQVELVDAQGVVHCSVEKLVHIRRRDAASGDAST